MKKIVLATSNQGKSRELQFLLKHLNIEVLSLRDFSYVPVIVENGTTFKENARIKAETICQLTNLITLADDSGLCVEALNNAPGIFSSRFAPNSDHDDEANNQYLLEKLSLIENRKAYFQCTLAIAQPNSETIFFEGRLYGTILRKPIGKGGFGYDPLFWLDEKGKSLAQLDVKEKNRISHRARAFQKAVPFIENLSKEL